MGVQQVTDSGSWCEQSVFQRRGQQGPRSVEQQLSKAQHPIHGGSQTARGNPSSRAVVAQDVGPPAAILGRHRQRRNLQGSSSGVQLSTTVGFQPIGTGSCTICGSKKLQRVASCQLQLVTVCCHANVCTLAVDSTPAPCAAGAAAAAAGAATGLTGASPGSRFLASAAAIRTGSSSITCRVR